MTDRGITLWSPGEKGPAQAVGKAGGERKAFRVLAATDLHLDAPDKFSDYYNACSEKAWELFKRTVEQEKPDLIVFVGDLVTGGANVERMERFCREMDELGIFWCPLLGNHEGDNPYSISRAAMVKRFSEAEYCLMEGEKKKLPDGTAVYGNGNYALHLLNDEEKVFYTLFFIDGGTDMNEEEIERYHVVLPPGKTEYEFIEPSQIEWYRGVLAEQPEGVPSVIFSHIPLQEYKEAYEFITENDTKFDFGVPDEEGNCLETGYRREGICCSNLQAGMFRAMQESGSTHTFICGHDHVNDFRLTYKGINLWYNIPGGYNAYNVLSNRKWIKVGKTDKLLQGCNVYTFRDDGRLEVEDIRYEDRYPEEQEGLRKIIRL